MKIQVLGRVLDVFESNGKSYVKFNDAEIGGEFKLTFDGIGVVQVDQLLNIDAEVKPGMRNNEMYLKVTKINNKKGGDS